VRHSYLIDCVLEDGASVGPSATCARHHPSRRREDGDVRGGQELRHRCRRKSAAPVLHRRRRRGRADEPRGRTITANYDGRNKHRTKIGSRVKGGVDTSFVAPVEVGDDAWTAAGSVSPRTCPPARWRSPAPASRTSRASQSAQRPVSGRALYTQRRDEQRDRHRAKSRASLPIDYNKRLMLFSGRANPQLPWTSPTSWASMSGRHPADVLKRRGLLPLRGVHSRRGRVSSCNPLRNAQTGVTANDSLMELLFMIDAAVGARPQGDRGDAVVRLLAPGQEVRAARAHLRAPRGAHAGGGGRDRVLPWTCTPVRSRASSRSLDHMTALFMLTQYFADLGLSDLVVVAPDAGRSS